MERVSILVRSSISAKNRCVLADVRDDDWLAVLRNPSGESLPHLDAHFFQRLRTLADGEFEIKFLLARRQRAAATMCPDAEIRRSSP